MVIHYMNNINTYNPHNIRLGDKAMYSNIVNRNNETLTGNLSGLSQTRYFSAVDARIYFGDVYIDEAQKINFILEQNTTAIAGYNSYVYDMIVQGTRYINGEFTINFTKSGYLYEVLNSLSPVNSGATLYAISPMCNTQIMSKSTTAPMWNKHFNIVIPYGTNNVISGDQIVSLSTTVVLKGVAILSCKQDFGEDGGLPISETYRFIARDMDIDVENNKVGDSSDSISVQEDDIAISDIYAKWNNGAYDIVCNITNNDIDNINNEDVNISIIFDSKYNIQLEYDSTNGYYTKRVSTNKNQYRNSFEYMIATYLYKSNMVGNIPIITVSINYLTSKDDEQHNITSEIKITYK